MTLSKPQRTLLSELVAARSLPCDALTLRQWRTAAALEERGLAERVLGELLPTARGAKVLSDLHDEEQIDHVCAICTKTHRTEAAALRCATRHVPLARTPSPKRKRKRKHKCISCGALHDSKTEARACLDSHW